MVTIRPLGESDWVPLRDIRLEALRAEPGVFCSRYDREVTSTQADWKELARGSEFQQLFGLVDGERIVGITAVFTDREDPSRRTALLAMSYIAPEYRGAGLARLLYEARLEWIRRRGRYERIRVSHRRSNERSKRVIERYGFREVDAVRRTWPDGTVDDEVRYEMRTG